MGVEYYNLTEKKNNKTLLKTSEKLKKLRGLRKTNLR
jgi:hypothetical protein